LFATANHFHSGIIFVRVVANTIDHFNMATIGYECIKLYNTCPWSNFSHSLL
jgi:hypothetical protein